MDAVVEDEDAFGVLLAVDFVLEELNVNYTDLYIIMLCKNHQLNLSTPSIPLHYPSTILLHWLPQYTLIINI